MKRLLTAAILATSLAIPATLLAVDPDLTACTSDNVRVESPADVDDTAPAAVVAHIKAAYIEAAKALTFEKFSDNEGFQLFASKLTDADKSVINFAGQPVNVGVCGE